MLDEVKNKFEFSFGNMTNGTMNNEYKLLELLDRANLSDKELDEIPFGISTTFSRFFEIFLIQTEENEIVFKCNEVGGCFCEPMYVAKLNELPDQEILDKLNEEVKDLFEKNTWTNKLINLIKQYSKYHFNIKEIEINEFYKEDLKTELTISLRNSIEEAIENTINNFKEEYEIGFESNQEDIKKYELVMEVIKKVRKEF